VASVFVDLHKQEVDKFLKKPSPAKTRRWGVYRKCLEKIFILTPPSALFACHCHPALTQHSADVLEDIWKQYGDLSHSISIMIAAGLHVNASAACLTPDILQDEPSLKELYNTFSFRAKNCIINTSECFSESLNDLVRFVRRELSFHGEAEVGLAWWNEISVDLFSLVKNSIAQASECKKSKHSVPNSIAKAFSTLQNNLSTISVITSSK